MAKPLSVLIVGGVESYTQLILKTLKKSGYKTAFEQVATPARMRRALKNSSWQVVVSAYGLPKLDGPSGLKILQESGQDIPFIIVSDGLDEDAAAGMLKAGACDCISFNNLKRLAPVVDRELRRAAERQERKQMEEALRESEDKYKYLFEHSVNGKSITLPSGAMDTNHAFGKMLGYSQKELKDHNWQEITHPEDVELTQKAVDALLSGEKVSVRLKKRFIHKDGSTVWADVTSTVRRDADGNPLYLLANFSDISEQVRSEEELRELSSRQEAILAAVPDILMEVDTKMVYTWANWSGLDFFGKDVIGKKADAYFVGDQDISEEIAPLYQGIKDVIYLESWQRRKDGQERLLAWRCRVLKDKEGHVTGALSSAHDITERKQMEEALRVAEERYKLLFESAPLAINVTRGTEITYANPSYLKMFGLATLKELKAKAPMSLFAPEWRPQIQKNIQRRAKGLPVPASYEAECLRKDGTKFPVLMYLTSTAFADGPATVGFILDTTERKQAEEALQQSEGKYRQLTEKSIFGVFIIQDDKMVYVNPSFAKMFGYTPSEIVDTIDPRSLIHPEDLSAVEENIRKRLEGKNQARNNEYRGIKKDGSTIYMEVHGMRIDYQGKPGVMGTMVDITNRMMAEEALRQSEEKFRVSFMTSRDAFYWSRLEDGKILEVNPIFEEVWGYTREEAIGKTSTQLGLYRNPTDREKMIAELNKTGYVKDMELQGKRKDGSSITISLSGSLITINNEACILGAVRDITSSRLVEQALTASEKRLRVIFEKANDGISITGDHDEIIDVNPRMCEMHGYTRDELLKMRVPDLQAPEARKTRNVLKSELAQHGNSPFEGLNIHKSGRRVPLEISVARVELPSGGFYVSILRDISERKRAEQQQEIMYAILREVSGQLDADMISKSAVETLVRLTGYPHVCIALPDDDSTHWSVRGAAGRLAAELGATYPIHSGVIGNAFKTGQTQWVRDNLRDPHYVNDVKKPGGPALRSEFVALMRSGKDILGALNVESDRVDAFDNADIMMIQSGAEIISLALQNARLYRKAQEEIAERKQTQNLQEAVYRIAAAAETTRSLEELYPQIHQNIAFVMPADYFYITLYDEARNLLQFPYFRDAEDEPFVEGIEPAKGLTAYVLRTGKSLLCTQAVHDELERRGEVKLLGVASAIWLGVPLILDGKTIGAMVVQHYTDPKAYGEREQHMLEFVSTQVAIAINRKQAEEKILQLNASLEKRVEERTRELRDAQEKIVRQEKLALLGQLAGGVGHELRNPLGIISNAVYYLKYIQPEADEKVRQYHSMIEQEVRNSEKIITDLLDFARLEATDREPVAVRELVQRTLTRFPVPEIIKTELEVTDDLPKVYADLRQMEQVLGNLTVNACQAMVSPKGTSPLHEFNRDGSRGKGDEAITTRGTLTISAFHQKGMVAISVKDTGTGISPENLGKIFEPLFTTKAKGIGLGLAVSRKLAEANGGRIEMKSAAGKGSTFTLFLPVEAE